MNETLRTLLLIGLLAHHLYSFKALRDMKDDMESKRAQLEKHREFFKAFQNMGPRFLTNWNFTMQTLYLFIAVVVIFASKIVGDTARFIEKLRRFNTYNYYALVLPFTVFIPSLFWFFYNYDRELIFPKAIDIVFPKWLNHALHTNILLLVAVESMYFSNRPPKFNKVFKILFIYGLTYALVLCYTYLYDGIWLYGFLGIFDWPARIVAFLGIFAGLAAISRAGWLIHNHRYETVTLAKQKKSVKKVR